MNAEEIHPAWRNLTEFSQTLTDMRDKLTDDEFSARLHECYKIDRPGKTRTGEDMWLSQSTRDTYLAKIMRGDILIGS